MPDRGDMFFATYRAVADGSAEKGRLALVAISKPIHIRRIFVSSGGTAYVPDWRVARGTAQVDGTEDAALMGNMDGRGAVPTTECYKTAAATGMTLTGDQTILRGDLMASGDGLPFTFPPEKFVLSPFSGPTEQTPINTLMCFTPGGADITVTWHIEFQEE